MKVKDIRLEIANNPPNVCLIYGDEPFFLEAIEKEIIEHPLLQFQEMNLSVFEGDDATADEIEKVTMTYPFGCEKRFIVVKNPGFLKTKGGSEKEKGGANSEEDWEAMAADSEKGGSSADMEIFLNAIINIPDTSCLFLFLKEIPDKRRKYLAEIRKKGKVFDVEKLSRIDMGKWISHLMKEAEKQIGFSELELLIDMTGYYEKNSTKNMYDIANIVKKLISFMGDKKTVEKEMLTGIAPRNLELDIFKMIDTLSVGNVSHGIHIYEDMIKDGEHPMRILSTIVSQIRSALICGMAEANHESMDIMKRKIGSYSDYYIKMNLKRAKALGYKKLTRSLNQCLEAEFNIKSGKMHEKLAMEMLFVSLFT